MDAHTVIMGDINARIPDLNQFSDFDYDIKYATNADTGSNHSGKQLAGLCDVC